MANTAWRACRARCPYYIRSNDWCITCQGMHDGEEIRRKLPRPAACDEQFRRYCAMHYTACPIYQLIDSKKSE